MVRRSVVYRYAVARIVTSVVSGRNLRPSFHAVTDSSHGDDMSLG